MAWYRLVVVNEDTRPVQGVVVEAVDLTDRGVTSTGTTNRSGEVLFTALTGPHFFRPRLRRTSGTVGGKSFTGRVEVQILGMDSNCYDFVLDTAGGGTHTTLSSVIAAAITLAGTSGAVTIYVCNDIQEAAVEIGGLGNSAAITLIGPDRLAVTITGAANDNIFKQTSTGGATFGSLRFSNLGFDMTDGESILSVEVGSELRVLEFTHCNFKDGSLLSKTSTFQIGNVSLQVYDCIGTLDQFYDGSTGGGTHSPDSLNAYHNVLTLNNWWIGGSPDTTFVQGGRYTIGSSGGITFANGVDRQHFQDLFIVFSGATSLFKTGTSSQSVDEITFQSIIIRFTNSSGSFGNFGSLGINNNSGLFIKNIYGYGSGTGTFLTIDTDWFNVHVGNIYAKGFGTTYTGPSGVGDDHGLLTGLSDDDHTQYVLHSILTTTGDIFIASANGVAGRLAVGSANQVIGVSGGLPFWTAQSYLDHGSIGGLDDDDHTQYTLDTDIQSVDFLVGTASSYLAGEIVVGTTPGGELGNTWASPTVDATHSGSAHHTEAHTLASHSSLDHDVLSGLGDDDHSIYALLAGRSGGQTLIGDTASGGDLTLQSTANATRGSIFLGTSSLFELVETTGQLKLPTTGSGGGFLAGGDALWYRVSANRWRTPDDVQIDAPLHVGINDDTAGVINILSNGTGSFVGGSLRLYLAADHDGTFQYWNIDVSGDDIRFFTSDGVVVNRFTAEGGLLLPTTGSGAGIRIGGDVDIYRSAANMMYTPDSMTIAVALLVDTITEFTSDAGVTVEDVLLRDGIVWGQPVAAELGFGDQTKLTLSGNEITDISRATAIEGDGLATPDSSFGIWEATTNLIANGGLETNTTGWASHGGAASISRDTSFFKFGAASLQVTTGTGTFNGVNSPIATMAAQTEITVSFWIYRTEGSVPISLFVRDESGNLIATSGNLPTTVGRWFRFEFTTTTLVGDTGAFARITKAGDATDITFYIDGLQIETQPMATPYVETDGGTATRSAATIQIPVSTLFTPTQGWVAIRIRMGFGSSAEPGASAPPAFKWTDDNNNYLSLQYQESANRWEIRRLNGGNGDNSVSFTPASVNKGDFVTLVWAWTSAGHQLSGDGGAFTTSSGTNIPTLAATLFELGYDASNANRELDSDILWFMCGDGVLVDVDAKAMAACGNTPPRKGDLDSAALPTFLWDANSGAASPDVLLQDPNEFYVDYVQGTLTMGERTTEPSSPAAGRVSQYLYDVGGHSRPFWKDEDGDLYAPPREAMVLTPQPPDSAGALLTGSTFSLTSAFVHMVVVTAPITVDEIQWVSGSGGANADNVLRFALYSEDGQTRLWNVTDAIGTATGLRTIAISPPVTLAPGNYYILGMASSGTALFADVRFITTQALFSTGDAGENDLGGQLTVSSGVAPTTFDPTAITTPSGSFCIAMRFDGTVG